MSAHYECQTCSSYIYPDTEHNCKKPINMLPRVEDATVPHLVDENGAYEGYVTKDSGERQQFSTGMRRDTQTNKPRYDLLDRAMLKRWAELMARGAQKYGEENWRLASTEEELKRFKASAIRHMYQWLDGDTEEDHASAILFNVAGAEMVQEKLK